MRHTCATNPTTEADKLKMAELRQRNWSIEAIAAEMGKSFATVYQWLVRMGVEPSRPRNLPRRRPAPIVRNGKLVRPFTEDEDAMIVKWRAERLTYTEIARRLDRRPNSIVFRLDTLARHEERANQ